MRVFVLTVLCSTFAMASGKALPVAAGDCSDTELLGSMTVFTDALKERFSGEVLSADAVLDRLKPRPTANVDEIQRELDSAQTQFYSTQYERGLDTVKLALSALERLPPKAEAWKLAPTAHVLHALVLRGLGKKNEALDAFRRVLRVEPAFMLDPDYYSQQTVVAFEAYKKDLAKAKRYPLSITSSPAQAQVWVDGREMGKTPLKLEVVSGTYRVVLTQGANSSFVHDVVVQKDEALQIDLNAEATLSPRLPLCVSSQSDPIGAALKLAALVGADSTVVLRVESRNGEPGWLTAALVEVAKGAKLRDGGTRVQGSKRTDALAELAAFVLTGKGSSSVVSLASSNTVSRGAPVAAAAHGAEPKSEPAAPAAALKTESPAVTSVSAEAASGTSALRITSYGLMGVGAATAAAGLVVYIAGGADRSALGAMLDDQGRVKDARDIGRAAVLGESVGANNAASLVLGLGGLAAGAAGTALFFLFPPQQTQVSAGPMLGGGAWVSVRGEF